jgi:hypothetical protein
MGSTASTSPRCASDKRAAKRALSDPTPPPFHSLPSHGSYARVRYGAPSSDRELHHQRRRAQPLRAAWSGPGCTKAGSVRPRPCRSADSRDVRASGRPLRSATEGTAGPGRALAGMWLTSTATLDEQERRRGRVRSLYGPGTAKSTHLEAHRSAVVPARRVKQKRGWMRPSAPTGAGCVDKRPLVHGDQPGARVNERRAATGCAARARCHPQTACSAPKGAVI